MEIVTKSHKGRKTYSKVVAMSVIVSLGFYGYPNRNIAAYQKLKIEDFFLNRYIVPLT